MELNATRLAQLLRPAQALTPAGGPGLRQEVIGDRDSASGVRPLPCGRHALSFECHCSEMTLVFS